MTTPTPTPPDDAATPDRLAERLLRLLDAQREIYAELLQLAPAQRELIERSEPEALITLLGKRQTMVDRITAINEEIQPVQKAVEAVAEQLSPDVRTRIRDASASLGKLIDGIARADEDASSALRQQRDRVRTELKSLGNSKAAMSAYKPPGATASIPRYQDRNA